MALTLFFWLHQMELELVPQDGSQIREEEEKEFKNQISGQGTNSYLRNCE